MNRILREILAVPNGEGNALLWVNRVNAYNKRVGQPIRGYSALLLKLKEIGYTKEE